MNTNLSDSELLGAVTATDETRTLERLHADLSARAQDDGILDVAYRTIDTPVGTLLLAATVEGLVRVAYAIEDHDKVLTLLAERISPRVLEAPGRLDLVAREIDDYFGHRRDGFDVPLDFRLSRGFRRQVLDQLREIRYGDTASYGAIAAAAGNPKAVRAVGTACATNPLPVVVPCHRVVRSDGSAGGYVGGPQAKQTLLTLESSH
ncbi:methylated-DNA-[protein]-cysteine S-methyltransferase [Antricoccus suffuscus]|uniref:Methylated-DNA--protein-cysteine methyltransferase n=1 Tax=Antricoccus suffuscus TaxID=1629062 RepID=A0A2T1A106_9ACTN|nr:methylated-DNA--[protein]-cysteine S-methyltransferase [Antricoccus suffuscus]PRZ42214.1 methylated-DNA-[protein]-cysteine S-methyltransferase [Antricoccus suffuscus]